MNNIDQALGGGLIMTLTGVAGMGFGASEDAKGNENLFLEGGVGFTVVGLVLMAIATFAQHRATQETLRRNQRD